MRDNTRYTNFIQTVDTYVVTGLLPTGLPMSVFAAPGAAPGTLSAALFNKTTGKYTSTVAIANDTTPFKLSYKDGDGNITSLAEMLKGELTITKTAYKAPVAQKSAIGFNGATGTLNYTTVVSGDEAIIRITNTTETGAGQPYDTLLPYSYIAKATDTPQTILIALAAQINDNASFQHKQFNGVAPYKAVVLTGGLTIESVELGESFSVAVDGVLAEATRTLLTPYELGSGNGIDVVTRESVNRYSQGNSWRTEERSDYYPTITPLADPTKFYTLYQITNKNLPLARRDRFKTNIFIYVPQTNAGTVSTVLDFLLTA